MAGLYDFTIEQGVTFSRTVTWKDEACDPVDMTGMTYRSEVRSRDGFLIAVLADNLAGNAQGTVVLSLFEDQLQQDRGEQRRQKCLRDDSGKELNENAQDDEINENVHKIKGA